jgi:hypothetical protein
MFFCSNNISYSTSFLHYIHIYVGSSHFLLGRHRTVQHSESLCKFQQGRLPLSQKVESVLSKALPGNKSGNCKRKANDDDDEDGDLGRNFLSQQQQQLLAFYIIYIYRIIVSFTVGPPSYRPTQRVSRQVPPEPPAGSSTRTGKESWRCESWGLGGGFLLLP